MPSLTELHEKLATAQRAYEADLKAIRGKSFHWAAVLQGRHAEFIEKTKPIRDEVTAEVERLKANGEL